MSYFWAVRTLACSLFKCQCELRSTMNYLNWIWFSEQWLLWLKTSKNGMIWFLIFFYHPTKITDRQWRDIIHAPKNSPMSVRDSCVFFVFVLTGAEKKPPTTSQRWTFSRGDDICKRLIINKLRRRSFLSFSVTLASPGRIKKQNQMTSHLKLNTTEATIDKQNIVKGI